MPGDVTIEKLSVTTCGEIDSGQINSLEDWFEVGVFFTGFYNVIILLDYSCNQR